jgi:hypothetical protein
MRARHALALTVLGAIFAVLAVLLVISWLQGDESNHGGAGMHPVHSTSATLSRASS